MSDYWWSAMYQQSPRSLGGNVFKQEGVRYYLPKDLPAKFDKIAPGNYIWNDSYGMAAADVNGDGKISKEEAPPRLLQNFDRFDITKDGFITLREFKARASADPANADRPQRPRASGSGQ